MLKVLISATESGPWVLLKSKERWAGVCLKFRKGDSGLQRRWEEEEKKSAALIWLKPMKMVRYINQRNFKHVRGFRVQRKWDNAFNAGINMEMNLGGFLFTDVRKSLENLGRLISFRDLNQFCSYLDQNSHFYFTFVHLWSLMSQMFSVILSPHRSQLHRSTTNRHPVITFELDKNQQNE